MKKSVSTIILSLAFAASVFASPIPNKLNISGYFEDLGKSFATALPQVTGMQNIYADAYIGKVFPTAIPHFGGGVNGSFIKIDTSSLNGVFNELGLSCDGVKDSLLLPSGAIDLRVGGAILPFDVGFVFLKTPMIDAKDVSLGFTTFGMDVRYAILEDGIAFPGLSVGLGYLYNEFNFDYSKNLSSVTYDIGIHSIYSTVQVSKKLLLLTPFAGARFMVSTYNVDWSWDLGAGINDSGTCSSSGFDFGNIQTQLFAGCGLNFIVFQTTLTVMADLAHLDDKKAISGSLSFRLKM